jgi:hypothetical protein
VQRTLAQKPAVALLEQLLLALPTTAETQGELGWALEPEREQQLAEERQQGVASHLVPQFRLRS